MPTTPDTGCPAAYRLLSLDDLEGEGFVFAPDLDANGDRFICGKPLNPVVQARVCLTFPEGACQVPVLYSVRDNDVVQRWRVGPVSSEGPRQVVWCFSPAPLGRYQHP